MNELEVVIQHARNAVAEAAEDDGIVTIQAAMLSLLLDGIDHLRNDIQELTCGDPRLVCPNCKALTNEQVDTHDPAGMARWLMERYENTKQFLALTDDQQRNQFLERWQQNVLPHLAFRFKQAAEMIERMDRSLRRYHEMTGASPDEPKSARCESYDLKGAQCAQEAGHDGPHHL